MKILIIGSGGREQAIGKKLKASPLVSDVYCAPGNIGMTMDGIKQVYLKETDHEELIRFVEKNSIDWTFVGPEIPLLNGIVDDFIAAGKKIFGPTKAAALIEGSKSFAKEIMNKYEIPTAISQTFTEFEAAKAYVEKQGAPIVIKADGLAAGKGVVVALTISEAVAALEEMLQQKRYSENDTKVVIEEYLIGEEISLLAFVRGREVYPMVISQDHKRAYDGDLGPNTGGMGAYSPVPQIPQEMVDEAIQRVLIPVAAGLEVEDRSFTGVLYAGLIATDQGPKVIEFNARFGDPETQVILPRLKSDLALVISDLLDGKKPMIEWETTGFHLGVVVAASGYPGEYQKGKLLPDFRDESDLEIYYAGVAEDNGKFVGSGGRLYLVGASGNTIEEAQEKIYQVLEKKDTSGTFYRKDIGQKAR